MLPGSRPRGAPRRGWCPPSPRALSFLAGCLVGAFAVYTVAVARLGLRPRGGGGGGALTFGAGAGGDSWPAPRAPFLVATSSSCEDIVPPKPWITDPARAGLYDVVVFDYSANHSCWRYITPAPGLALLHRPRTFKWPAMHAFFTEEPTRAALGAYAGFLLTDDDVDFHGGVAGVARLFELCAAADLHICQPALSAGSAVNMDVTAYTPPAGPDVVGRATRFVEQMSPLFSREALGMFLPFFRGQTHAWGIDTLW